MMTLIDHCTEAAVSVKVGVGSLGANRPGTDSLRAAPVRMLPRVCAPAQAPKVEVLPIAEEVSQLHEEAVRQVPQPKDSDVLTPAQRAAGTHGIFGAGLCHFAPRG